VASQVNPSLHNGTRSVAPRFWWLLGLK